MTRRGFVALLSRAGAAAGVAAAGLWSLRCRPGPIGKATGYGPGGRTMYLTRNDDFYLVAIDPSFRPGVDPSTVERAWRLDLVGLDRTAALGYRDLVSMRSVEVVKTFECIGNEVGGDLIGNANWRCVPLRDVLAPVLPDRRTGLTVMFHGLDEYYDSVSIERALDEQSFIAYSMNGEPLPAGHGFPARVLLPDLYGMKQPRWLAKIEILDTPETTGYWERRGWASEVPVKTMSRLDVPPRQSVFGGQRHTLTGVAYAGARRIQKVEVSVDGGVSWTEARLTSESLANAWALWAYEWTPPASAGYTLVCRATDETGAVQTAKARGSFPDGASGWHRVRVEVG
ncbi:MAG: molybdopterin-dependent oxidoreductase [Gemmatimonadetes bacterium]|nr:molybdopterin-dependent oxidoreductase [Gemmatimonadota bacterium]